MTCHSNKSKISDYLLNGTNSFINSDWKTDAKWAFLIHSSVLPVFRKFIKWYGVCYLWDIWKYNLQIDETFHDMRIVFIPRKSDDVADLMKDLVRRSQYTFFWENRITLFRDVDNFHELEEFIDNYCLQQDIVSVEVEEGINSHNKPIKVVTFNRQLRRYSELELYKCFERFLREKKSDSHHKIYHYYLTYAFSWHQPARLSYFDKPFKNKRIFSLLQMYLTCLRETSYKTEPHLDIIGLCSLKLAFCDFRNVSAASDDLGYEIDQLIIRSLKRMTRDNSYIRDGQLSLEQYGVDRNLNLGTYRYYMAHEYFTYTFQDYFKLIKTQPQYFGYYAHLNATVVVSYIYSIMPSAAGQPIILVEENDVLQKIRKTTNLYFEVIGKKFAGMNYELFTGLLSSKNVSSIILDTNYEWQKLNKPKCISDANNLTVLIELLGGNKFNFIEDCIESLKLVSNIGNLRIVINARPKSLVIFNSLKIAVICFADIKLTSVMLQELLDYRFSKMIIILNCKIENEVRAWELLHKINWLSGTIIEDEKTWQYMFDFAANWLSTSQADKFRFTNYIDIVTENKSKIGLENINFTISECKSRLELNTYRAIDLYDLKNETNSFWDDDDISDYEFYQ